MSPEAEAQTSAAIPGFYYPTGNLRTRIPSRLRRKVIGMIVDDDGSSDYLINTKAVGQKQ